jgi:hypothetical protein
MICALALILVGCSQPAAEDKFLSHWDKITSLISDNAADAAKAAAAVKQYLKDHLEEMKELGKQFGKDSEKKIAENPAFIRRVMEVVDKINTLQQKNPELMSNTGLNDAFTPLAELFK